MHTHIDLESQTTFLTLQLLSYFPPIFLFSKIHTIMSHIKMHHFFSIFLLKHRFHIKTVINILICTDLDLEFQTTLLVLQLLSSFLSFFFKNPHYRVTYQNVSFVLYFYTNMRFPHKTQKYKYTHMHTP